MRKSGTITKRQRYDNHEDREEIGSSPRSFSNKSSRVVRQDWGRKTDEAMQPELTPSSSPLLKDFTQGITTYHRREISLQSAKMNFLPQLENRNSEIESFEFPDAPTLRPSRRKYLLTSPGWPYSKLNYGMTAAREDDNHYTSSWRIDTYEWRFTLPADETKPRGRRFQAVSRQKIIPNLPIWWKCIEFKGIMVNTGRIHREFRNFQEIF